MNLSGWGRYPRGATRLITARRPADLDGLLTNGPLIARGAGRAYGDAAIGPGATLAMGGLDRMMSFDPASAVLTVEAGVMLGDVVAAFLPRGYFPPVVPGTRFVTIGGMVASHIHGKNHHAVGGFGRHVTSFTLLGPDGVASVCSPAENPDLFRATIGGMGLTGVILDVSFKMLPVETGFIRQETIVARNLDAALAAFEQARGWTYVVAWIDALATGASLGRSLIYLGEHARRDEIGDARSAPPRPSRAIPIDFPDFTLNRLTVSAFNAAYFQAGLWKQGEQIVPVHPYFFPLDGIGDWNHVYGARGFVQHQCVIPKAHGRQALGEILELVSAKGSPSFVSVLKLLGPDDAGLMGFPMEGYTLALDFPASHQTLDLLSEIDRRLIGYGGRLYLTKDARQSRETLAAGYPNLPAFRALRKNTGAGSRFVSLLSERLAL
ncbi:FAD-binding oxidoreductase [soil metagenome]